MLMKRSILRESCSNKNKTELKSIRYFYEVVKRLHEKEVWEGSSFLQGPSFSYLVIRYFLFVYSSNQQSSPCNRSISSKPIQSHRFFMKTQFKLVCLSYPDTVTMRAKGLLSAVHLECPKTIQPKPSTQSATTLERIQRHRTSPDGKYLSLDQ